VYFKRMEIESKEIEYIADLSRIMLSDKEKMVFKNQLADILDYIKKLNKLNTDAVEPMSYTSELNNVFREDKLTPSISRQKILDISPANINGFFKVPKVIE